MTNGNDAAFPTLIVGEDVRGDTGLTKRELFAAMAMQGMCADSQTWKMTFASTADSAVKYADALIDALNCQPESAQSATTTETPGSVRGDRT